MSPFDSQRRHSVPMPPPQSEVHQQPGLPRARAQGLRDVALARLARHALRAGRRGHHHAQEAQPHPQRGRHRGRRHGRSLQALPALHEVSITH